MTDRYIRQMAVPGVGATGQARLAGAHVVVIGAGGLGCPVLQYLAGAGVGRITLVDPDTVEESNLHRQPLYRMADLGRPKAEAARDAVLARNPGITVEAQVAALTPLTAPRLVDAADVVVDAADSFAVSYTLSDACLAARTPLISASVLGQAGYIGGYCGTAPSLRAVFPEPPATGATCTTAGVLGPVVGMFGTLQAQMALRVLLGDGAAVLGRMITADLADMRFGGFAFLGSPEPAEAIPFIARQMLRDDDLVIDLRGTDEVAQPLTTGALRMGAADLRHWQPPRDRRLVLCCQSGLRAWQAADDLSARGCGDLALLAVSAG
ncbi:HesA/MoeB/ThiF family protein [Actibacterium ureilyticum]|uniref:HesA/MoeB/ThiF family protein n=1 Tax=Actibacterium ureilyticum TaxID=1590614 RepID=UPI000BAB1662|nr:HesA/MoeB/ThiF family protein [Actibacterium ureilyticum]